MLSMENLDDVPKNLNDLLEINSKIQSLVSMSRSYLQRCKQAIEDELSSFWSKKLEERNLDLNEPEETTSKKVGEANSEEIRNKPHKYS
jgi:hypothetical protein